MAKNTHIAGSTLLACLFLAACGSGDPGTAEAETAGTISGSPEPESSPSSDKPRYGQKLAQQTKSMAGSIGMEVDKRAMNKIGNKVLEVTNLE